MDNYGIEIVMHNQANSDITGIQIQPDGTFKDERFDQLLFKLLPKNWLQKVTTNSGAAVLASMGKETAKDTSLLNILKTKVEGDGQILRYYQF